jgi:hypothetical protein
MGYYANMGRRPITQEVHAKEVLITWMDGTQSRFAPDEETGVGAPQVKMGTYTYRGDGVERHWLSLVLRGATKRGEPYNVGTAFPAPPIVTEDEENAR